jgi:flagellar hook-associated protein 2
MSVISSLGVGSGLDLNSLVGQLVDAERLPQQNRLDRREAELQAQFSAFGSLKSNLSTLDSALSKLQFLNEGRSGASSNSDIITARIDSTAAVGEYRIEVSELARGESRASNPVADPESTLGTGTFSLQVGSDTAVEITVAAGSNDLFGVRNAINDAGAGVRASIVNDASGSRLVLSSEKTGADNDIQLTGITGSFNTEGLAVLDSLANNASITTTAQNAEFSIDGLALESASNQLSDTLQGINLELRATTAENSPVIVSVTRDREAITDALNEFVEAYNSVISQTRDFGRYNPETEEAGILLGDSTLRSIQSRLASGLQQSGGLEGSDFTNLMNLGIRTDRDGQLSINSTTLDQALDDDFLGVLNLVKDVSSDLRSSVRGFSEFGGLLDARTDGLSNRIGDIERQREVLDSRMERYEALLTRQFSVMDALVGQLQNTSEYLTQQLGALNN